MSTRNRSRRRRNRTRSTGAQRSAQAARQRPTGAAFWGDPANLPDVRNEVRMTADPDAVPRSLGQPPLPGHETAAEHYFAAVYDRAVTTAGALAAAGGMIDPDTLADELGQ